MRAEFGGAGLKGSADARYLLPPIRTRPRIWRRTWTRTWPRPIKRPGFVSGLLVPIRRIDAVKFSQQRRPRQFTVPVG